MNDEQIRARLEEMKLEPGMTQEKMNAFVREARAARDEKPAAENEEELVGPLDGSSTIFEGVETPEALTEVLEQSQVTEEQEAGYKSENKQSYDSRVQAWVDSQMVTEEDVLAEEEVVDSWREEASRMISRDENGEFAPRPRHFALGSGNILTEESYVNWRKGRAADKDSVGYMPDLASNRLALNNEMESDPVYRQSKISIAKK